MSTVDENVPAGRRRVPIRWWVLIALVAFYGGIVGWLWLGEAQRQEKVVNTILLTIVLLALGLLWIVVLSRLRWYMRLAAIGAVGALGVAAALTLRVEGVSGDLVPSLSWRWTAEPGLVLPDPIVYDTTPMTGLADYAQFLGPGRDGMVTGLGLVRDWTAEPPRERWRREVGAGWSAFAVRGNVAVTQEQRGDDEVVVCYDVSDAREIWVHADDERYGNPVAGLGPRATPTIEGGLVYTLGATGLLNCLDLETGARRWSADTIDDAGSFVSDWGNSGSPLVVDDLVIVNPGSRQGRSLIAYERTTGVQMWSSGNDVGSYSSPAIAEIAGVRQVLVVNGESVTAHAPADGEVLWRYEWPGHNPKVAQPLVLAGNRVFLSAGYGLGAVMLEIAADDDGGLSATELWKSRRLKAKFTNVVHRDGFLYGLDDGIFTCVDAATGRRQWKDGRYGHGQVILVDDVIIVQAEDGRVVLVDASPQALHERGEIEAFDSKTWNNATLAGRYLLVRNDREAACYELSVR